MRFVYETDQSPDTDATSIFLGMTGVVMSLKLVPNLPRHRVNFGVRMGIGYPADGCFISALHFYRSGQKLVSLPYSISPGGQGNDYYKPDLDSYLMGTSPSDQYGADFMAMNCRVWSSYTVLAFPPNYVLASADFVAWEARINTISFGGAWLALLAVNSCQHHSDVVPL